jgi:hypothetical protein
MKFFPEIRINGLKKLHRCINIIYHLIAGAHIRKPNSCKSLQELRTLAGMFDIGVENISEGLPRRKHENKISNNSNYRDSFIRERLRQKRCRPAEGRAG